MFCFFCLTVFNQSSHNRSLSIFLLFILLLSHGLLNTFFTLAATYPPISSPIQYSRPSRSLPSCSGWVRVFPRNASPPDTFYVLFLSYFLFIYDINRKNTHNWTVSFSLPLLLLSLRKEVIQPHLPIRLPCYDFTPVISPAFGSSSLSVRSLTSGVSNSHGVTGGVYKTRERIHRNMLICDY